MKEITKEDITDSVAALIILTALYQSVALIQVDELMKYLVGAAVTYLFVKNSPNTV